MPQADEKIMKAVLSDEKERNARVFQFPTSAIKQNGHKINYYDFLIHAQNADCNAALKRIVPGINREEIRQFIDKTEGISDLQKEFYKCYIDARYELIIKPAFEIAAAII